MRTCAHAQSRLTCLSTCPLASSTPLRAQDDEEGDENADEDYDQSACVHSTLTRLERAWRAPAGLRGGSCLAILLMREGGQSLAIL